MINLFKEILIEINGVFLWLFLGFISLVYKMQCFLVKESFSKNHNVEFEVNGVKLSRVENNIYSRGSLNNYTEQHVSLLEYKDGNCLVSLEIPFKSRAKASKSKSFLISKFKEDSDLKDMKD